ncbi:MAG: DUF116 domain-containing protein [Veillonellaceae bacterium]|nr:DUF116 domain-containing protein [Veillonellaceae bacterium]
MDPELSSYRTYMWLCGAAWLVLAALTELLLYLLAPGLALLWRELPLVVGIIARGGVLYVGLCLAGTALAAAGGGRIPQRWLRLLCRVAYRFLPYCLWTGAVFGIGKERVAQGLIDLINRISLRYLNEVRPEEVMLLTPHCLQWSGCPLKVTHDAFLCKECGRCPVAGLVRLAKTHHVGLHIATGGTFARLLVKKHRPKVIIAIACERDLVLGMCDVFPILVFGVLNARPNGPCYNTQVDLAKVERILLHVLRKERAA